MAGQDLPETFSSNQNRKSVYFGDGSADLELMTIHDKGFLGILGL
jgi:hypothetical protein